MRYLLGTLLFTTTLFAAESRFSEAEAKFNREYDAAKAVFDRAVKVAQDKLIVAYNEEMKRLTVKGDLDGAVALRDKIKNLETEAVKKAEPKLKIEDVCGNWKYVGDGWPKGTVHIFNPNMTTKIQRFQGTWKIEDRKIIIDWGNDTIDTLTYSVNSMKAECKNGGKYELLRQD